MKMKLYNKTARQVFVSLPSQNELETLIKLRETQPNSVTEMTNLQNGLFRVVFRTIEMADSVAEQFLATKDPPTP
jgi:hypothetical protein